MPELVDGTTAFNGGQDASKAPSQLPENTYYAGVNISIEKGIPRPRWALTFKDLKLPGGGQLISGSNNRVPFAEIFEAGRFQLAAPYAINGVKHLLVVISGIIYLMNIVTLEVTVIVPTDGSTLNQNTPRLNWSNAGKYFVIHDYPNLPMILEGTVARRSDQSKYEVPVSTVSAYNQNRLFIGNTGIGLTGGDPTGNLATPNAPITFEEVLAPGAAFLGQFFELPTQLNGEAITAMGFLQLTDTSTGIGPLLVATANAIYSYPTQNPRTSWEQGAFGTAFVSSGGIAGGRAFVNVNSDVFFLSGDGQIRSVSMSRDDQKKWSKVPISREISNWLKYSDETLIPFAALGYFNNKVFVTVNPYRVKAQGNNREPLYDVAFGGFGVIGFDNMATLGHDGTPAWDGLWTGVRPMDIVTVGTRCFVISKDEQSVNRIYELDSKKTFDSKGNNIRYVRSILYTREYDCKMPFQNKEIRSLDVDINEVKGELKLQIEFKPSHVENYAAWTTFNHKAPWRFCNIPTGCEINGFATHGFKDLTFGKPESGACDPVSDSQYEWFRALQLKFTIEAAYWELQAYALKANPAMQANLITSCENYNAVSICKPCSTDWFIGAFESCLPPVM